jgi:hypothetical protein
MESKSVPIDFSNWIFGGRSFGFFFEINFTLENWICLELLHRAKIEWKIFTPDTQTRVTLGICIFELGFDISS